MGDFHVLVGPNGSGKTTLLDVISFLGRLVSDGIDAAIEERSSNFYDLLWQRTGSSFELAIELDIPEELRDRIQREPLNVVRYQVRLAIDEESNQVVLDAETVLLMERHATLNPPQISLFPRPQTEPETILEKIGSPSVKTVINKSAGGNDNFYSETYGEKGKGWVPAFKLGPRRSALSNLPEDESRFPVATWLKETLTGGVQKLVLNSLLIRQASPPGRARAFQPDGSNLPWVIHDLERRQPGKIGEWIEHLRTALPDLEGVRTVERPDDRHRYLMLTYEGGLEVPSWMASDGTLRLLALTLPAYLPEIGGNHLIEEPENGIHPRAGETMYQSLSSVYGAQILLATHSPVIFSLVDPEALLCFAKDPEGATDIVLGSEHPALQAWRGRVNLATLHAAGVLG
jgi:predicted ATPase